MPAFKRNCYKIIHQINAHTLNSDSNRKVDIKPWNEDDCQKWFIQDLEDNYCKLVQKATGQVLDANKSGQVDTKTWNGGDFQKWFILKDLERDYCKLVQKATGRVLDGNNEGKVYTEPWNNGKYQKWMIEEVPPKGVNFGEITEQKTAILVAVIGALATIIAAILTN